MDLEELRLYCLAKPHTIETLPFDGEILVFKVLSKMFLLINLSHPDSFNVKCNPGWAIELREEYSEVTPGFHMNKKLWNTVRMDGNLPDALLRKMIDHSYDEVVAKMPLKDRKLIAES